MSAAVHDDSALHSGHLVATLGPYSLYFVTDRHYQLFTPDNRWPRAWVQHNLPAGEWLTEWAGHGADLIVHLSR